MELTQSVFRKVPIQSMSPKMATSIVLHPLSNQYQLIRQQSVISSCPLIPAILGRLSCRQPIFTRSGIKFKISNHHRRLTGIIGPTARCSRSAAIQKNKTSPFIISIKPDYRMISSNSFFDNVTGPAGALVKNYPTALTKQHGNFVTLPNNIPIPGPNVTGMRGDGMQYDYNDIWLLNAFRLSETSKKSADPKQMIGFVHDEDYWGYGGAVNGCTYKSIGVRYSNDLGLSWTRSVPILTRLIQPETHDGCLVERLPGKGPASGTGDMAAIWNHITRQWVIYGQEGQFGGLYAPSPALVMSVSSDPLGRPGTWTRIDPTTNRTDPGFIGSLNRTLTHGDLKDVQGANPSIIRDSKNKVWHMVHAPWGGGIAYANSSDLMRWTKPMMSPLINSTTGSGYPTLIGDEGDTLSTMGKMWIWFKGNARADGNGYNVMYGAKLDFGKRIQISREFQNDANSVYELVIILCCCAYK